MSHVHRSRPVHARCLSSYVHMQRQIQLSTTNASSFWSMYLAKDIYALDDSTCVIQCECSPADVHMKRIMVPSVGQHHLIKAHLP